MLIGILDLPAEYLLRVLFVVCDDTGLYVVVEYALIEEIDVCERGAAELSGLQDDIEIPEIVIKTLLLWIELEFNLPALLVADPVQVV